MARIAGVDLPRDKRVDIALTYIFGIGPTTAKSVIYGTKVNASTKVRDLTEEEVIRLRDYIEKNLKVEGYLRREIAQNIRRLIEISCYRGIRHRRGLPLRGQRTRTNARTRKGPRRGIGIKKR